MESHRVNIVGSQMQDADYARVFVEVQVGKLVGDSPTTVWCRSTSFRALYKWACASVRLQQQGYSSTEAAIIAHAFIAGGKVHTSSPTVRVVVNSFLRKKLEARRTVERRQLARLLALALANWCELTSSTTGEALTALRVPLSYLLGNGQNPAHYTRLTHRVLDAVSDLEDEWEYKSEAPLRYSESGAAYESYMHGRAVLATSPEEEAREEAALVLFEEQLAAAARPPVDDIPF